MSMAYEYDSPAGSANQEAEAFMESVTEAARAGRRYRPLALAAMAAARAALSQGRYPDTEGEFESALEGEWEITPGAFRQSFTDHESAPSAALMEHLGHAAAEAESNGEAFAFLAPLLPLALKALPLAGKALGIGAKVLPKVASKVVQVAPRLIKGVNAAAKTLRTNPATKPLVQALPQVVRRTAADLARQVAQGKPLTGQTAVRTLAQQTAKVLGDPRSALQALGRAKALDRRVDQAMTSMVQGCGGAPGQDSGGSEDDFIAQILGRARGTAAPCKCSDQPA
jgi:hypothetical protein